MTEEEIKSLIQRCGSLGHFASRNRSIIPVLRKVKDAWPALDTIFFAFMHMFYTQVPQPYMQDCRDVWCRFYAVEKDISVFVRNTLDTFDQFNKLMLADKGTLQSAIADFLASFVERDLEQGTTLRNSKEASLGQMCFESLCMCSLLGNTAMPFKETPKQDLRELADIARELFGKPTKRARDFPEFSDSEDGEGDDDEPNWEHSVTNFSQLDTPPLEPLDSSKTKKQTTPTQRRRRKMLIRAFTA